MSINPLDINANVNKLAEISKLSQEMNNRSNINISHAEKELDKRSLKEKISVNDAEKESKLKNDRKNNKQDGHRQEKQGKKSARKKDEDKSDADEHIIDIRI